VFWEPRRGRFPVAPRFDRRSDGMGRRQVHEGALTPDGRTRFLLLRTGPLPATAAGPSASAALRSRHVPHTLTQPRAPASAEPEGRCVLNQGRFRTPNPESISPPQCCSGALRSSPGPWRRSGPRPLVLDVRHVRDADHARARRLLLAGEGGAGVELSASGLAAISTAAWPRAQLVT